jgi:hypothetical protein
LLLLRSEAVAVVTRGYAKSPFEGSTKSIIAPESKRFSKLFDIAARLAKAPACFVQPNRLDISGRGAMERSLEFATELPVREVGQVCQCIYGKITIKM